MTDNVWISKVRMPRPVPSVQNDQVAEVTFASRDSAGANPVVSVAVRVRIQLGADVPAVCLEAQREAVRLLPRVLRELEENLPEPTHHP